MAIRKKYPKLKDVVTERQDNISIGQDRENKLDIGDVRDPNYQNELIKDFLVFGEWTAFMFLIIIWIKGMKV